MTMPGRYAKYFTQRSQLLRPSAIRALQPLLARPGVISLGGGLPNSATFPVTEITLTLTDGTKVEVPEPAKALQYSNTDGLPALLEELRALQLCYHGETAAKAAEQRILLSTGSQDALTKTFELLLEPEDTLLLEEYTYSGSLSFLRTLGCRLAPVATDEGGIVPGDLRARLDGWKESDGRKPKVIYTIPTGSNPMGISIDLERRRELYKVAQDHDLLVLEDDPYYFLQFTEPWYPSLYSMDVDARVVRFDSFSKILSSGLRLGFMTGPKEVVDKVELKMQATSLHTSGVSQGVCLGLFRHWEASAAGGALGGFQSHVEGVIAFYRAQREAFLAALERHLSGLCTWRVPDAGMFVWIEILGTEGSSAVAQRLIEEEGVLVVSGLNFHPEGKDCPFIRVSYSTASADKMDEALSRFARLLKGA